LYSSVLSSIDNQQRDERLGVVGTTPSLSNKFYGRKQSGAPPATMIARIDTASSKMVITVEWRDAKAKILFMSHLPFIFDIII